MALNKETSVLSVARLEEPPYARIMNELRARVHDGRWEPGKQIVSERKLAVQFGVCHSTIKKSLKELEREGLLWSHRGKGRFVSAAQSKATYTVGLALFDTNLDHPVQAPRLAGINEVTHEHGYHLKIIASKMPAAARRDERSGSGWGKLFSEIPMDGLLISAQQVQEEDVRALADRLPIVWMDRMTTLNAYSVRLDYTGGALQAGKHLIALGHRKIGMAILDRRYQSVAYEQYEGLRLALLELGVEPLVGQTDGDEYTEAEGRRLARGLLSASTRPTAIVCGSDELALGVYRELTEAGLRIPDDISLIGWNDTLNTLQVPVPLTTIRMDFREAGRRTAERMMAILEQGARDRRGTDLVAATLVVRQSTTAPRDPG